MSFLEISGGVPLYGSVAVSGSKNAALPIIFASVATEGISVIENAPDIGDVRVALDIISDLGAVIERRGDTLLVDTRALHYKKPDGAKSAKIRASSYLIGACLARFLKSDISEIGGCAFCYRPIDMHIFAAQKLGAELRGSTLSAKRLKGADISFDKISVGATMNALIMAAAASGETVIRGAAREPHVKNLIEFLSGAGALIEDDGEKIRVVGAHLGGSHVRIIPDMIEAGTLLLLGPLTEGRVCARFEGELGLDSFFEVLTRSGISVEIKKGAVSAYGTPSRSIDLKTSPYPGFPTDLQPQCAPLMAKYFGGSIEETVWANRFSYFSALSRFGVGYGLSGDKVARVFASSLHSADAEAPDLRGGAAIAMAALSAEGKSRISGIEKIERGYFNFAEKLKSLGAIIS